MSVLEIKKYPAPVLRKVCSPVKDFGQSEETLLEDMAETMYQNQGVGLAAPQVGISKRLLVADAGSGLVKLVNAKILRRKGRKIEEEGCLSLSGVCVEIKRAEKILIEFMDRSGNVTTLEVQGLLARVIQHEIDHLNGRMIIDYINPVKRFFVKRGLNLRNKAT